MPGAHDLARSWRGSGVDAIAVEHALANLTRQARPTSEQTPTHPIPRARVMTLVVRAAQAANLGTAMDEISHLANCHPLRALIVRGGTGAPAAGLDALAAIECAPRSGTPSTVCLERIQLTLSDAASAHLSSVVAPLLIPDLPVVLWWLGDLPGPDDTLLELSGNLIVDSDALGVGDLPKLNGLIGAIGDQVNVRDRAWTALDPVRDILAELFDPAAARPYQFGVTSLDLTVTANASAQPLLLLGWLASRLSWAVMRAETSGDGVSQRVQFTSAGGPIEASLTRIAGPNGSAGSKLIKVAVTARHAGHATTFTIARQPGGDYRVSRSAIPDLLPIDHPVALTRPPLVAVLNDLLAFPKEDGGYRAALSVASQLMTAP